MALQVMLLESLFWHHFLKIFHQAKHFRKSLSTFHRRRQDQLKSVYLRVNAKVSNMLALIMELIPSPSLRVVIIILESMMRRMILYILFQFQIVFNFIKKLMASRKLIARLMIMNN